MLLQLGSYAVSSPAHRLQPDLLQKTNKNKLDSPHLRILFSTASKMFLRALISCLLQCAYCCSRLQLSIHRVGSPVYGLQASLPLKTNQNTSHSPHLVITFRTASKIPVDTLSLSLLRCVHCIPCLQLGTYTVSTSAHRLSANLPPKSVQYMSDTPHLVIPLPVDSNIPVCAFIASLLHFVQFRSLLELRTQAVSASGHRWDTNLRPKTNQNQSDSAHFVIPFSTASNTPVCTLLSSLPHCV